MPDFDALRERDNHYYREARGHPDFAESITRFFTPEEQSAHEVSVVGGRLIQRGVPLDTRAAEPDHESPGSIGEGANIFAVTPAGAIRAADPGAEKTRVDYPNFGMVNALIHHSSMAGSGGERDPHTVAAAGELRATAGRLEEISDASGHYRPTNDHTHQGMDTLAKRGVDMHDVAMRFVGKEPGQAPLIASAREFQESVARNGHAEVNYPEILMRDKRAQWAEEIQERASNRDWRLGKDKLRMGKRLVDATPARRDPRAGLPPIAAAAPAKTSPAVTPPTDAEKSLGLLCGSSAGSSVSLEGGPASLFHNLF